MESSAGLHKIKKVALQTENNHGGQPDESQYGVLLNVDGFMHEGGPEPHRAVEILEDVNLEELCSNSDSNHGSSLDEKIKYEKGNTQNYKCILLKRYTSIIVKEEPIQYIKSVFNTSNLEFEKQRYHQEIFENIFNNHEQIKVKNMQLMYLTKLREAAGMEIFTCSVCSFQTINMTTLNCHFLINHNGKIKHEIFKCHNCDYETSFLSHIARHLVIHNKSLKDHTRNEQLKKEKFLCLQCNYKGRSVNGLERHMALHKDKTKCDLCSFKSDNKNILKEHKESHKSEDKYQCYMCEYSNKNKVRLASKRSKICEICSKSFGTSHQLRVHYLTHKSFSEMSDSELFKCTQCFHQTKYKANFKMHMLMHKAPEFTCDICGFSSKHKHSYENHLITHKRLSEINWFQCSICPYKCRNKNQIRSHMKKGIHSEKNLRHIRNRDRIREAQEKGQIFVVKNKAKKGGTNKCINIVNKARSAKRKQLETSEKKSKKIN